MCACGGLDCLSSLQVSHPCVPHLVWFTRELKQTIDSHCSRQKALPKSRDIAAMLGRLSLAEGSSEHQVGPSESARTNARNHTVCTPCRWESELLRCTTVWRSRTTLLSQSALKLYNTSLNNWQTSCHDWSNALHCRYVLDCKE